MQRYIFECDRCGKQENRTTNSMPSSWASAEVSKPYEEGEVSWIWCDDCWSNISYSTKAQPISSPPSTDDIPF